MRDWNGNHAWKSALYSRKNELGIARVNDNFPLGFCINHQGQNERAAQ